MKKIFLAILTLILVVSCTKEFDIKPVQPHNSGNYHFKELPDSGLVDIFEFTGIHGDTVLNGINSGNYGIIHGGITHCPDRFNNTDCALQFDGTDGSYIETLFGGPLRHSARTISLWFKPADTMSMQYLFCYGSTAAPTHSFNIGMFNDGGGWCIKGMNTDDGLGLTARDTVPPINVWQNLVIVFDPSFGDGKMQDVKFYLHGVEWILLPGEICTFWDNNFVDTWTGFPYTIGSDLDGGRCFNGCIDDIRIYNRALTEEEIFDLFMAPDPTPPFSQYNNAVVNNSCPN